MTDIDTTTNGPIELRSIRQPLDPDIRRALFHDDDFIGNPLPGLALIASVAASLIGLGALLSYVLVRGCA